LHDSGNHYTHFTGFLLEEEIVASLWGSTSKIIDDTNEKAQNERRRGKGRKFIWFQFVKE
jgi:hypothetical protein